MRKVKLGIIGLGNMGSQHATGIWNSPTSELEVSAVADINPDRLEWAKVASAEAQSNAPERNIPVPATFTDASEMLKSGLCEAVIIATPHYQHPVLAKLLLRTAFT